MAKTSIEIKAVIAKVEAPASVDMAHPIEVTWQGPANDKDYIAVARPEQQASGYLTYTYINKGNPLKAWAPSEPGTYEVRYILGRGRKILARAPIIIE